MTLSGAATAAKAAGSAGIRLNLEGRAADGIQDDQTGDRVTLSAEGKRKAQESASGQESSANSSRVQTIRQRIQELQKEILELGKSALPDKEKQQRVQILTQEMLQLQQELEGLQPGSAGGGVPGGTRAQGMAGSLT